MNPPGPERGPGTGPSANALDCAPDVAKVERVPSGRFDWERAIRDDENVVGNRLLVLLTLGIYMKADGTNARPSQETLASKTGLHPGTIGRHLRWARTEGWLEQVARGGRRGDGIRLASIHRATVPIASLPRNECDVQGDVENLYRAPDDLHRAADPRLPRNECATITSFGEHGSISNTALCDRCDDAGLFQQNGSTFLCNHPLLTTAGLG